VLQISESKHRGVFTDRRRYFTINATPGENVYGETLKKVRGREFRQWNPYRSKLAAVLHKGCRSFPLMKGSNVIYLGAASGTTASHVSDLVGDGKVWCVEFSPRSFRDLVGLCEKRKNMYPVLADANFPKTYEVFVDAPDILYQDVSQKNQVQIFMRNFEHFFPKGGVGWLMLKTRSIEVREKPINVFRWSRHILEDSGYRVVESLDLAPFQKDHWSILVES